MDHIHFEHERRVEIKSAFAIMEKAIDEALKTSKDNEIDIATLKQKYDVIHREKNHDRQEFEKRLEKIDLKIDGDGNGKEGLIRKMDTLRLVPEMIKTNTTTMRWTIGIMVTVNLAMFATIISIVRHG